jgi:YfiH family protein
MLMLRFADCVPILLLDPGERVVGIVHAGWRGTLAKIGARAVATMVATYGCRADQVRAAIGPSIGPCCFEVGPEVVDTARQAFADCADGDAAQLVSREQVNGKAHLDLWSANAIQLRDVGVRSIETAGVCTKCNSEVYFSHRATGGRTGRFAALIGLQAE